MIVLSILVFETSYIFSELENLFSTLNPSEEERTEKVRDVKIEDEPVVRNSTHYILQFFI